MYMNFMQQAEIIKYLSFKNSLFLRKCSCNQDFTCSFPQSIRFGQYLASTLPTQTSEQHVLLNEEYEDNKELQQMKITINQRNALLDVLIHLLMQTTEANGINSMYDEHSHNICHKNDKINSNVL